MLNVSFFVVDVFGIFLGLAHRCSPDRVFDRLDRPLAHPTPTFALYTTFCVRISETIINTNPKSKLYSFIYLFICIYIYTCTFYIFIYIYNYLYMYLYTHVFIYLSSIHLLYIYIKFILSYLSVC